MTGVPCIPPAPFLVGIEVLIDENFIAGAIKGEDDIALGNIIGANIFNTCLVLGLPALVAPGSFNPDAFHRDYWVMLAVSVVLLVAPSHTGKTTLTTALAQKAETPNSLAKIGIAGPTIPNPRATQNDTIERMKTSGGIP